MIRVSDLQVYMKCPRICYFLNMGHKILNYSGPRYLESILIRELALSYGKVSNSEDKLSFLIKELDRISKEIHVIYRAELAEVPESILSDSISNVVSCLENICLNLSSNINFYSIQDLEVEPRLHSEKLGLTGIPDKLIRINGRIYPSIIKTGRIPENGVWQSDRLQITAHAMLVEERYDTIVERGFVEYAKWGKIREVIIKRYERRKVLQIKEKIKKIQDGIMPEKPEDASCTYCDFNEICDARATLASRFF
ncbi:MAG TPA: CRISPR-associated protein Cas4 [Candidatus Methanoperedens sp.]